MSHAGNAYMLTPHINMQSDLCVCESVFHERRQEMDLVCTHLCVDVLVHVCRLDGAFMRVCACVCVSSLLPQKVI